MVARSPCQNGSSLSKAKLPEGLELEEVDANGNKLLEFVGDEQPRPQILGFRTVRDGKAAAAILITAQKCPHVVVKDRCVDDHLTTEVSIEGTLPCISGRSGDFWISVDGSKSAKKVEPGKPLVVSATGASLHARVTLNREPKPLFEGRVEFGTFSDVSPEVVVALVEFGAEFEAAKAYKQMHSAWDQGVRPEACRAQSQTGFRAYRVR